MKVFVIGGAGFIGRHVVASLVRHGHRVTALVRNEEQAASINRMGALPRIGDIHARETIREPIAASDVVVNAAMPPFLGRMTERRVRYCMREALNQMRDLLETVAEVGKVPLVLTEGAMALGDSGDGWLDESSPYTFDKGYGKGLRLSVPYQEGYVRETGLPTIKLSLTGAYGPGSWFALMYSFLQRGWFRIPGTGQNTWSFVHVDDAAEAYRLAVEQLPIGESFLIADDEPCTYADFANFVGQRLGKPTLKSTPIWLGRLLLGSVQCEALAMNTRASNSKLKRQLGWRPKYPTYREGVPPVMTAIEGLVSRTEISRRYLSAGVGRGPTGGAKGR